MIAFELQRTNMVESQVRPSDITDRRIMRAMQALPREDFAAPDTRDIAYMDADLPIGPRADRGPRRALVSPRVLARLIQGLAVEPDERVLEVGTGTGYGAAVLARLAKSVVALETDTALAEAATRNLAGSNQGEVRIVTGPLSTGWPAEAPYGAILVSGSIAQLPAALLDQLRDGGRLAAVLVQDGVSRLTVWTRFGSSFAARTLGDASAPALPGFERPRGFVF